MMRLADFTAARRPVRFRVALSFGLATSLAMLLAQTGGQAAASADALPYSRSFLLTGNYVVGGVDLNSKSAVGGFVNGSISISGVPDGADIVAATMYWETVWTARSQLNGVTFRGEKLTDIDATTGVNKITSVKETEVLPLNSVTSACLGANQMGLTLHLSEFRADVLHLLP